MQVEYELTLEDVAAFQRYGRKRRVKARTRTRLWVWVVLAIWFIACFLLPKAYAIYQEGNALRVGIPVLVVAVILATFVIKLIRANSPEAFARRMFEHNPGFFRKTKVTLSSEGFVYDSPSGREVRYWRAFKTIEQTADHAFFFTTPTQAYFVPRHAFPDEEAFAAFLQTARRYHGLALEADGHFSDRAKEGNADQRITQ